MTRADMFAATKNPAGLLGLLSQSCEQFKNKTAIECGERQISYESLDQNANRLANCLIAQNLTRDSIVAVVLDDRIEMITALIGILRAGCVFVPLDPDGPERRLQQIIETLTPDCLIADSALAASMAERNALFGYHLGSTMVISLGNEPSVLLPRGSEARLESFSSERPAGSHRPDDMCYVYHTSGSTGVPKGIAGRLKSLGHFINWEIDTFGLAAGARVSQLTPPTFDPFLRDVLVPLCVGGTVCIPPHMKNVLEPRLLIEWLDSNKINLVHCVPFLFNAIVHENPDANKFAALEFILMAGEALQTSDVRKWWEIFGERIKLVNLYGSTETTMIKLYHLICQSDLERDFIPIGKPMKGAKAIILDDDHNVCPPGVAGELYIRTDYLTLGYYRNPELTKEVFIPNPLTGNANDIVYKTGDLARVLSDGNFQFLGRNDSQVKIRGNRVELGEIESTLRRHDLIRNAVVTMSEDSFGGDKSLIAYLVADRGGMLDINELRRFLNQRLPNYMMPAVFVQLDQLPLTPNGKVNRLALPVPDEIRPELMETLVAPRTAIEEMIAGIWADVLRLEKVGVHDNFFELGGHSLKATQVISRIGDAFQGRLSLQTIFQSPTVAELALVIEQSLIEELEEMTEDEIHRRLAAS